MGVDLPIALFPYIYQKVFIEKTITSYRDLEEEVTAEKIRKDLYYRLNVFPISIPPLRERVEDIAMLVWAFVRELEQKIGKRIDSVSRKTVDQLQRYSWPGNVRELRNFMEYSMIISKGNNLVVPIPDYPALTEKSASHNLEDIERRHIIGVLQQTGWRISGSTGAANLLCLKRTTPNQGSKNLESSDPDSPKFSAMPIDVKLRVFLIRTSGLGNNLLPVILRERLAQKQRF